MMRTKIFLSILFLYNLAVLPTVTAPNKPDIVDIIYPDGKSLKVTMQCDLVGPKRTRYSDSPF